MPLITSLTARRTLVQMIWTTVRELTFDHGQMSHEQKVALAQHFADLETKGNPINTNCGVSVTGDGRTRIVIELSEGWKQ